MGYRPSPPPADPAAGAAAAAPAGAGRYGLHVPAPGAAHAAGGAGARPRMSLDLARLQPPDTASPAGGQARRACLAVPVVRVRMAWCGLACANVTAPMRGGPSSQSTPAY
jgi:hypothetical protein